MGTLFGTHQFYNLSLVLGTWPACDQFLLVRFIVRSSDYCLEFASYYKLSHILLKFSIFYVNLALLVDFQKHI